MKQYLAIFLGTPGSMAKWQQLPEAERKLPEAERKQRETRGLAAWHGWVEQHRPSIVQIGSPLGKTKSVSSSGIADIRNNMGAWTVVQADSQEAAAKLFENHPHFTIFPGESIEVMECLQIPGA
jgi:hypothetical protein